MQKVLQDMELWTELRRRVLTGELSRREAAREYGLNYPAVAKACGHVEPPGYRSEKPRKRPKMESFLPRIAEILEADKKAPKKQRHTAKRLFDRLREEVAFDGSYESVKEAVREWRQGSQEVFLPLSHPPGEAQVDFGYAYVDLAGERVQVALFVMTLPYSDALFIQAFPRECTESFQEGHKRAFEFFGGVPKRISYDNSRVAIAKITGPRDRERTREFLRLESHYLFRSHFCLVRRANEKGKVEGLVGFGRRNFLVPVPRVDSLEALNEELLARCEQDLGRTLRGKSGPKQELLKEDQAAMLPLPRQPLDARRVTQASACGLSLVSFDTNRYSVPVAHARRPITVVASVDEVRLIDSGKLVAKHPRSWKHGQDIYNPVHYLALLEKKPGGFDHAKPLEDWALPPCFDQLRRLLEADGLGTREYIRVLRLLERFELKQLEGAVEYALDIGVIDADAVRVIAEHRREEPLALFSLDGRPHLRTVEVETTRVAAYGVLLTEGRS
ncbi:Integrase core domain protein [Pirellulimonas nuda]|uniref:Integrase core domain protein n=1 Tax=Pirellulimonas nuda TaxID=2528009 RepID=A0A518DBY4_9BACT|nr:IS21 family transposase [Pirellulimonas nuda]QDU88970.1 Integrase core domain protein [Pirellulimonas nuda]